MSSPAENTVMDTGQEFSNAAIDRYAGTTSFPGSLIQTEASTLAFIATPELTLIVSFVDHYQLWVLYPLLQGTVFVERRCYEK